MKLLVATDLHGSKSAVDKVVSTFHSLGAQKLVLLGDLYYHGPRNGVPSDYDPMYVATSLNALSDSIIAVRGNCDSEVDQTISNFQIQPNATLDVDGVTFMFTHGHKYNAGFLPPMGSCQVLMHGHTHVNSIVKVDGVVVVNVGSPSFPKDGKPAYCVVDVNEHEYEITIFRADTDDMILSTWCVL